MTVQTVFYLSQSRRLPLLQVVSNNKSFSVGVQSPTEINAPRGCAVILRRICQLSLTRITHQVSRAFDLKRKGTGYMEELKILLEECVCEKLIHMTASGARDKDGISKVRIRPVLQKGSLMFQSAARKGKQEFHSNCDRDELIGDVMKFMEEDFRQLQIQMQDELITVLISKKGKVTIKRKKSVTKLDAPVLMHNRKKHYILEEGIPVPFLIDLGVQTARCHDGRRQSCEIPLRQISPDQPFPGVCAGYPATDGKGQRAYDSGFRMRQILPDVCTLLLSEDFKWL